MTIEEEKAAEPKTVIIVAQKYPQDLKFAQAVLDRIGGFKVIEARTASDVIRRLPLSPDLILVNIRIEGNFVKAMELLRRTPQLNHVSIAVLSGDKNLAKQCLGKGFNGFIARPYTPETLLASVWNLLESSPPLPDDGSPATLSVDIDQIEGLPTLPTVYTQVEELCQDPNVGADQLAKVIETDPSITMKLLKLANSAFFGFSREIKSVRDSVSLLGNQTVQNAVLSISIFEAMKDQDNTGGLDKEAFWEHSAAVGAVVRFITKKMRIQREESFTSGILHDIGKVILGGLFSEFYKEVIRSVNENKIMILEAEEVTLGLSHTRLGMELAKSWGIPERLVDSITYHHTPKRSELDPELASLVNIADAVARSLEFGSGGDPYVPVIHPFALQQLAISGEDLLGWEEEMKQSITKDMAFLKAIA